MGDALSTVHIYHTSLIDLPLQNDFATIPATKAMDIEILPEETESSRRVSGLSVLTVPVSNPTGIRLKDIFSSIAVK
jgi:hypothetical protein